MRPFKFFFFLSIGIMLFSFFAKIVLMALFVAALMSIVFMLFRKVKRFFKYLAWEETDRQRFDFDFGKDHTLPVWENDIFSRPSNPREKVFSSSHRTIVIQ